MLFYSRRGNIMTLIDFPSTATHALINIGCNTDPILPPANDTSVVALCFEPMVFDKIPPTDRLFVVPVAVADEAGLTSMGFAGGTAQASSLAEIGDKKLYDHLHADERKGKRVVPQKRVVPIMPMRVVLDSLRDDLTLWFLKTDMQGFDYRGALKPAGERLKKIHYVNSETFLLGVSGYSGVSNDYCQDTLPLMLSLGFEPVALLTWWSLKTDERIKLRQPKLPGGRQQQEWPYLFHHGVRTSFTEADGHHTSLFAGSMSVGEIEARAYCRREAAFLKTTNETTKPTGTREANAFFRRPDTTLPAPPVLKGIEDWPYEHAKILEHAPGKMMVKMW